MPAHHTGRTQPAPILATIHQLPKPSFGLPVLLTMAAESFTSRIGCRLGYVLGFFFTDHA
jgi:hypothetical protein